MLEYFSFVSVRLLFPPNNFGDFLRFVVRLESHTTGQICRLRGHVDDDIYLSFYTKVAGGLGGLVDEYVGYHECDTNFGETEATFDHAKFQATLGEITPGHWGRLVANAKIAKAEAAKATNQG